MHDARSTKITSKTIATVLLGPSHDTSMDEKRGYSQGEKTIENVNAAIANEVTARLCLRTDREKQMTCMLMETGTYCTVFCMCRQSHSHTVG